MRLPTLRASTWNALPTPLTALWVLGTVLALNACSQGPNAAEGGGGGMPPPAVTVQPATVSSVPLVMELPATLAGSREVEIRARVSGILESREFDEGGSVRAGQSLFRIDDAPFRAAAERLKADLVATQARHDQARRNLARVTPLRKENAVSQREFDDAVSAEAIAAADVLAAEARVREANLNLGYTRVESPISGVAGRALVSEGTLVPGPELLLTRVTQLDPVKVRFGLSQPEQLRLRRASESGAITLPEGGRWTAQIRLPDGSLYGQSGVVNFSDVRIDPQTGTSEMQAVVPNPDTALRSGQFVRVVLSGAIRHNAIVVPQRAVLDSGTGKYVYLAAPGQGGMTIAQQAPVEVGEWVRDAQGANGWVILSGLKAGDPVIVDGVARIFFPGMPVQVAGDTPPPAQSSAAGVQ